ncbi:hypothetical protein PMAYCL1PPCAC_20916, partial [Pristionchus mayeri]
VEEFYRFEAVNGRSKRSAEHPWFGDRRQLQRDVRRSPVTHLHARQAGSYSTGPAVAGGGSCCSCGMGAAGPAGPPGQDGAPGNDGHAG